MLRALLLFVAADALGEAIRLLLHVPVSGAVLGMVLLFSLFALRPAVLGAEVERTGRSLLGLLPLFFVPAGVGVAEHAALIARYWDAILAAMLGSSVVALLVTGLVLRLLDRPAHEAGEQDASEPLLERPS